jgi:hypothetical protein
MLSPSEMKGKFEKLSEKDGYIDSIFNYCDRWCEKCSFTSRCRNFAFNENGPDADAPELWEYLGNIFKATMLMLEEKMLELGIDPENLPEHENKSISDPDAHPLFIQAKGLANKMHDWLEKNKLEKYISDKFGIFKPEDAEVSRFKDSLEVIYWYMFLVPAKIGRALSGLTSDYSQNTDYDSNGSVKIALISLDRLIAAWTVLMNRLPALEDEILHMLIDLTSVRKQTETLFPNARRFVRPGLDE